MGFLTAVAIALSVSLLAYAGLDIVFSEEARVRRRLDGLGAYTVSQISEAEPLAAPFAERVLKPALGRFGHLLGSLTPGDYTRRLSARVVAAGRPGRLDVERVLLLKLVSAVLALGAGIAIAGAAGARVRVSVFVIAAAVLLFSYLPDLYLKVVADTRMNRIRHELPDMLDMLTIAVEAGLGFDQAVSRYVQHSSGPLAREFGIALMETQAGKSRRDALHDMADRVDVAELRTFVLAIVQADVFGVSVSDVLRTQSHEMRVKRRQHAEELAQKAPAKMAFPLILCILPATLIVVITPAVIGIMVLFSGG